LQSTLDVPLRPVLVADPAAACLRLCDEPAWVVGIAATFMKSLVIEDDPDTLRYICNGLKEAGHAVTRCDNGLDGLHQALNETWDLIILDRLLPGGVDGLSIVGKLRDLGKSTPVLIVSALTDLVPDFRTVWNWTKLKL
jgi:response regulator RpfG family c-di-GMP phosphodiesterase